MDIITGHDVRGQVGDIRHVVVTDKCQVRDRADGLVDCLDIHARHRQVFDGTGNLHGCVFRVDADFTDMTGHTVKTALECLEVAVRHTEDGMCRFHDVGIVDGLRQFRTDQAVTHIGIEHRSEREVPE